MAATEKSNMVNVAKPQSLGERLSSCFKDVFKSCYNFDKTAKTDPGDRKSAKLELIEAPPTGSTEPADPNEPPRFNDAQKYPTVGTSQPPEPYPGSHDDHMIQGQDPGYYPPTTRQALPSMDSFDFSEEDADYWKQASEVMKRSPPKSALTRKGSRHKNSKLVRFGSVVRRFGKLEELMQQPNDDYEEYYDEEGSEFDDYEEEDYADQYYDQHGYQEAELHGAYGEHDYNTLQGEGYQTTGYATHESDQYYDEDPYGQVRAQSGYSEQHSQLRYPKEAYDAHYTQQQAYEHHGHADWGIEHAQNDNHHGNPTEHAQRPETSAKSSLSYRGSFKHDRQVGGVVPSASFSKPLAQDEYKVNIKARVKALESGSSQQSFDDLKKPATQDYLPVELSLPNYEMVKAAHAARIGQPLYTHPGGYKFRIDLWACGKGSGVNTHISVSIHSMEGENNDQLMFPARFVVSLELLNQYRDYDHHQKDIECFYREGGYNTEIGRDLKFIHKDNIYWNAQTQTQYLLNDVLRFRVTRITLL